MTQIFDGRTAIITGAGKGIGRATATLLAARGAQVVAIARTASDLDSLTAETAARTILADLADTSAAREAMRAHLTHVEAIMLAEDVT